MKGSLYTLVYSVVLGTVCALLLTGASEVLAPYKEANRQAERVSNILKVLNVPVGADVSAGDMVKVFGEKVSEQQWGKKLSVYVYSPTAGQVEATAVSFAGQGLWGPIKGLLALEADGKTIRGISFYEQEETPGLGGEIGAKWFRQQFVGKMIVGPQDTWGVVIRGGGGGGGDLADNEVAAITGATMTCDKVQAMLNEVIGQIREFQNNGQ